jgi:hypothetical protein
MSAKYFRRSFKPFLEYCHRAEAAPPPAEGGQGFESASMFACGEPKN